MDPPELEAFKETPSAYAKIMEAGYDSLKPLFINSELSVYQCTKLNQDEMEKVKQEASHIILKDKLKSAADVSEWPRIFTGCETIDSIIRGGIPVNGIVEIVGASGVGKTQLCLQLSLTTQFPVCLGGLEKGVVYICTEAAFPSKRFMQLMQRLPPQLALLQKTKFGNNVYIEHVSDFEQLRRCLYVRLPQLLERYKIGLIIVDSMAGPFRSENADVNYALRSQDFHAIALQLNNLGKKFETAIVCTNQISDNVETGTSDPCLGLAWSNLVTCRFGITRLSESIRLFKVIFAPDLPNNSCRFLIKDYGLEGI